jgi:hypothetical protein
LLVGTEWIEIEEPAEYILDHIGGDDAPSIPMQTWLLVTCAAGWSPDPHSGDPVHRSRKAMQVAVSKINAVREPINEGGA